MKSAVMTIKQRACLYDIYLKTIKRLITPIVLTVSFFALTGCASVKFYSDPGLKNETGLRYYTLKPYLLLEYKAEKDNTVKTTVVYLPDLSDPQYIVLRPGIGASEIKMTFANSALESYGVVTESQLPESLEAFAAMLSKSAYATQAFTAPEIPYTVETGECFKLYEIISGHDGTILKEIIPDQQNK
jgi:hypothetical protein